MESVSSLKHKMSALFYKIEGTYVGVDKPSRINLQKQDSKAGISPGEGRVPNGNICNLMLLHIRKISLATSKSTTGSQLWGGVEKKKSSSPDTSPRDPIKACRKCAETPTCLINTIPSNLSSHANVKDFKPLGKFLYKLLTWESSLG